MVFAKYCKDEELRLCFLMSLSYFNEGSLFTTIKGRGICGAEGEEGSGGDLRREQI